MPDSYIIKDQQGVYFLTFQIVNWLDIFIRKRYRDIVVDAFNNPLPSQILNVVCNITRPPNHKKNLDNTREINYGN